MRDDRDDARSLCVRIIINCAMRRACIACETTAMCTQQMIVNRWVYCPRVVELETSRSASHFFEWMRTNLCDECTTAETEMIACAFSDSACEMQTPRSSQTTKFKMQFKDKFSPFGRLEYSSRHRDRRKNSLHGLSAMSSRWLNVNAITYKMVNSACGLALGAISLVIVCIDLARSQLLTMQNLPRWRAVVSTFSQRAFISESSVAHSNFRLCIMVCPLLTVVSRRWFGRSARFDTIFERFRWCRSTSIVAS